MAQMKQNSSRFVAGAVAALVALFGFAGCSSSSDGGTPAPTKTTYTGTLYLAATTGGHVSIAPVTIDPSNTANPITVAPVNPGNPSAGLHRVQLRTSDGNPAGTGTNNMSHVVHDVRLDGTKLWYSTIMPDGNGNAHVGYVDLASPTTAHDAVLDAVPGANGMIYCGSGKTATHFVPMTMSSDPYIDAIPMSSIVNGATLSSAAEVKRTYVSALRGGDTNFTFAHGINSPNGQRLFVAVNEPGGQMTSYLVDMADIVAGTADPSSIVTSQTLTGLSATATVAFRSTFTPNGDRILQAGADRLIVLDAATLDPLDNNTTIGGNAAWVQAHDVMPTPDGKYAILSIRFRTTAGTGNGDAGIQLYDLAAKKTIGNPVSTCNACHVDPTTDRFGCGIDGSLTTVTQ